MRRWKILNLMVIIGMVIVAGCIGGVKPSGQSETPVPWNPDGVIKHGEYQYNFSAGDFTAFFRVENGTLFVGMKARTRGWLAIGFGGSQGMKNTDIVIAYVLPNGTVRIRDDYSTGFAGPHNPDTTYGGMEDIISYGGREGGLYGG
ncbi:DOMON domain-containing protein [Thermococcus sp.]|uniref:DOMON domain-containing protein n=1 Tax=Thermococcus sp. TaxID=35749 RepID=UPI00262E5AFA|nr:DOMON domain-containing protein [Thermococcus sp.]